MTDIAVYNINIAISDRDYSSMLFDDDYVAYTILQDNSNIIGHDYNTGSVIPYNTWKRNARIYCVNTSRIKTALSRSIS